MRDYFVVIFVLLKVLFVNGAVTQKPLFGGRWMASILRTLTQHNRVEIAGLGTWSCVGAYAAVTAPGPVRVGDEVDIHAVA